MRLLLSFQRIAVALVLALAGLATVDLTASPVRTSASAAGSGVRSVVSSYDSQVLKLTNQARVRHGLRPLMHGSCIDRKAETWSRTMAARNMFRHQSAWGILRACDRRTAGENIAMSGGRTMTPATVVRMWMKSPGHRANILNKRYRTMGLGAWTSVSSGRMYVAQTFGG